MRRAVYGRADEKFIKSERRKSITWNALNEYHFRIHPFIQTPKSFNRKDVPIAFKCSPKTLLELCVSVVNKIKLPSIYEWSNKDVCNWIHKYGYPHYQNTFRVNLITGRKLLLVDAQVLCEMNIKNFDDIRHISYGIRQLFYFEMTKYMHSISLPPQYHYELYKLFMVKTGRRYELTRRGDLWRHLQVIRPAEKYYSHWELLQKWLEFEPIEKPIEIIAGTRRPRLYSCKLPPPRPEEPVKKTFVPCTCFPPCTCHYTKEKQLRSPTVLKILSERGRIPDPDFRKSCLACIPPCTCYWSSAKYEIHQQLSILKKIIPQKYEPHNVNYVPPRLSGPLSATDLFW